MADPKPMTPKRGECAGCYTGPIDGIVCEFCRVDSGDDARLARLVSSQFDEIERLREQLRLCSIDQSTTEASENEAHNEVQRLRSALERIASCTFENGEDIDDIQRWSRAALEVK